MQKSHVQKYLHMGLMDYTAHPVEVPPRPAWTGVGHRVFKAEDLEEFNTISFSVEWKDYEKVRGDMRVSYLMICFMARAQKLPQEESNK